MRSGTRKAPAALHATAGRSLPPHVREAIDRSFSVTAGKPRRVDGAEVRAPEAVKRVIGRPGTRLDTDVLSAMQRALGRKFSDVRVHADGEAQRSAAAIGARAYTLGNHIVFGHNAYRPDTPNGLRTLAHELVHVAQGGLGSRSTPNELVVGESASPSEREAERLAAGVLDGTTGQAPTIASRDNVIHRAVDGSAVHPSTAMGSGHYRIELKAWIPHPYIVDPLSPAHPLEKESFFHGDGHTGYDGGYRALAVIEFDFDGTLLTNRQRAEDYGETIRYWVAGQFLSSMNAFFAAPGSGGGALGTDRGRATKATEGDGSIYSAYMRVIPHAQVNLGIHTSNPLVPGAPDIDSHVDAGFEAGGSFLNVDWQTDTFPSHGLRIYKDGSTIATEILFDASHINALGAAGAFNVANGLTDWSNAGSRAYRTR